MTLAVHRREALAALGVLARRRVRSTGAVVFAYHDVGPPADHFTRYSVSADRLRRQVATVLDWGIRFVPLPELVERLSAGREVTGMAAVTFDDAIEGVHAWAAGILADLGVPATVFAVSAGLGQAPPWWPGSAPTMTAGQLRELVAMGWDVGSHTRTHLSLNRLTPDILEDEVAASLRELEDLLQRPVDLFAYPFGHHDPAVRAAVAGAGYRAAFGFRNGRVTTGLDRYRLPRFTMHEGLTTLRLAHHLAREPTEWPNTHLDVISDGV